MINNEIKPKKHSGLDVLNCSGMSPTNRVVEISDQMNGSEAIREKLFQVPIVITTIVQRELDSA